MQATSVTPRELAVRLTAVIHQAMSVSGGDVVALFEELGLTITQVKLLNHLAAAGEINVKSLSESMHLSLPGTSRAADALIRRGLVERREDPADRRSKLLTITPAGREAAGRIAAARVDAFEPLMASLTDEQRAALVAALAPLAPDGTP
ncbi:MAG TPA: MarR family transcriptional regulator [Solirubrobacteraceae bacterium]|nr:MarR family transcriptional regulator [Solirubrobacteraceae bacterium]